MIDFEFLTDKSSKGTRIKYIKFHDNKFRLSEEQKSFLKDMCIGYFFYSKTRKMWGFTDKDNNQSLVNAYLKNELTLIRKKINQPIISDSRLAEIEKIDKNIYQDFGNLEFVYIRLKGRPLYFTEKVNEKTQININLEHSFFVKKDETEMNFAKKIVSTLVLAKQEYTSSIIDSYLLKVISIQEQIKNYFDRDE